MKKINIKKDNIITHQGTFKTIEEANEWIAQQVAQKSWGKPERWVSAEEEDVSKALEQRVIHLSTTTHIEYKMAAEYEVEIIDTKAEVEGEKIIKAAKEAKKNELVALKGKSLSNEDVKKAVELFIEIWPI